MQISLTSGPHYLPSCKPFILILVIIFIWIFSITLSHYYRYYFTKKELKKFFQKLKFLESEKGLNPYREGKFASLGRYSLIKIILSELWDIHYMKIRNKDVSLYNLKIKNIRDQIKKILLIKNYKLLFMCVVSIFSGLMMLFLEINSFITAYFYVKSVVSFEIFFSLIKVTIPFFIIALVNSLLSIWTFTSAKKMISWLFIEITNLELHLIDKYDNSKN